MDKLGIEPVQLLTQAFNFVVMLVILTKFLYKPVLKMLDERQKKIAEGLAYTEKMKEEVEKTEKKRQDILDKARDEAREIVEAARKEGKRVETEIVEKAHEEATAILKKGKQDLEIEQAELEKRLKSKTVDLASAIAVKVLEDTLSDAKHKLINERKINALVKRRL